MLTLVLLDDADAKKFMGLTSDMYVQSVLCGIWANNLAMIAVVAEDFSGQYTSDAAWPSVTTEWTALRQNCNLLKAEGVKISVMMGLREFYMA